MKNDQTFWNLLEVEKIWLKMSLLDYYHEIRSFLSLLDYYYREIISKFIIIWNGTRKWSLANIKWPTFILHFYRICLVFDLFIGDCFYVIYTTTNKLFYLSLLTEVEKSIMESARFFLDWYINRWESCVGHGFDSQQLCTTFSLDWYFNRGESCVGREFDSQQLYIGVLKTWKRVPLFLSVVFIIRGEM